MLRCVYLEYAAGGGWWLSFVASDEKVLSRVKALSRVVAVGTDADTQLLLEQFVGPLPPSVQALLVPKPRALTSDSGTNHTISVVSSGDQMSGSVTQYGDECPEQVLRGSEKSPEKELRKDDAVPEQILRESEKAPEKELRKDDAVPEQILRGSEKAPEKELRKDDAVPEQILRESEKAPEKELRKDDAVPEQILRESEKAPEKELRKDDAVPEQILRESEKAPEKELRKDDAVPEQILRESEKAPEKELRKDDAVPEQILRESEKAPEKELRKDDAVPEQILRESEKVPGKGKVSRQPTLGNTKDSSGIGRKTPSIGGRLRRPRRLSIDADEAPDKAVGKPPSGVIVSLPTDVGIPFELGSTAPDATAPPPVSKLLTATESSSSDSSSSLSSNAGRSSLDSSSSGNSDGADSQPASPSVASKEPQRSSPLTMSPLTSPSDSPKPKRAASPGGSDMVLTSSTPCRSSSSSVAAGSPGSKRHKAGGPTPGNTTAIKSSRIPPSSEVVDLLGSRVLTELGRQPSPYLDPYGYHPEARRFDFSRYAGMALRWIRPLAGDSTPYSWRADRTPGITGAAMSRRIVYVMWLLECGWSPASGRLSKMQEGKMLMEALKFRRTPRFRASVAKDMSPVDIQKATALPSIPAAPESFKRCFLHYLENGEVLAEAKKDPDEPYVLGENDATPGVDVEILRSGLSCAASLTSPFRRATRSRGQPRSKKVKASSVPTRTLPEVKDEASSDSESSSTCSSLPDRQDLFSGLIHPSDVVASTSGGSQAAASSSSAPCASDTTPILDTTLTSPSAREGFWEQIASECLLTPSSPPRFEQPAPVSASSAVTSSTPAPSSSPALSPSELVPVPSPDSNASPQRGVDSVTTDRLASEDNDRVDYSGIDVSPVTEKVADAPKVLNPVPPVGGDTASPLGPSAPVPSSGRPSALRDSGHPAKGAASKSATPSEAIEPVASSSPRHDVPDATVTAGTHVVSPNVPAVVPSSGIIPAPKTLPAPSTKSAGKIRTPPLLTRDPRRKEPQTTTPLLTSLGVSENAEATLAARKGSASLSTTVTVPSKNGVASESSIPYSDLSAAARRAFHAPGTMEPPPYETPGNENSASNVPFVGLSVPSPASSSNDCTATSTASAQTSPSGRPAGAQPGRRGRSSLFSGKLLTTPGRHAPYYKVPTTPIRLEFGRPESFFVDKVPDVDAEGNELVPDKNRPVYSEVTSVMGSVWFPERGDFRSEQFCPGCVTAIWNYTRDRQSSWCFWRGVCEDFDRDGESNRLSMANKLMPERDMSRTRIHQGHHTCVFGPRVSPTFASFVISGAIHWRAGLNGHALRLQLRVGLLLPFVRPRHRYHCSVRFDARLLLYGLPAYYWGRYLVVKGTSELTWGLNTSGTSDDGIEYIFPADHLRAYTTGGAPGSLYLCPLELVAIARHGPRDDLHMTYVQCLWIETHYPPPVGSFKPRPLACSDDWLGTCAGYNSL